MSDATPKTSPAKAKRASAGHTSTPKKAPRGGRSVGATATGEGADAAPVALSVGQPAPPFRLESDDGQTYALADLAGRRIVLYFYPRDSTPGCTTEACDFRDRADAIAERGALVLGVSGDSLASHARFRAKQGLNFPLLSDPGNAVARAYGAYGPKTMYGKQTLGVIRSTFVIGADGRIEAIYAPVKVKGHAEAVLAALPGGR